MMTPVARDDLLPLTCTREGACCHGKAVWVNPWELAVLAAAGNEPAAAFRDRTLVAGIRLRHAAGGACILLATDQGCSRHPSRPLACRLFPLGRERHGGAVRYVHDGRQIACLSSCPGVSALPRMSVAAYLDGQCTTAGEAAQDAYLELAGDLAEGAFVILFDSGLARARGAAALDGWRSAVRRSPEQRATAIGPEWLDLLTIPAIDHPVDDPRGWIAAHHQALQAAAQAAFASLTTAPALMDASTRMLDMALHAITAIGGDAQAAGRRWLDRARSL